MDTQTNYLKDCFDFLGITEVEFIYEEGLAMLSKEESLTAVKELFNNIKSVRAFLTTQKKTAIAGLKLI
ncbi:MAG: NAD(P)H-dependent oxidoreductase [Glaciecola sp.]|nr:NAD(P)H-dependent oxidoreductase [Glaciecola sp.]